MRDILASPDSVDWMHPSWRDLVIQELSADDTSRHSFLNKCEIDGFILALSLAGGQTGKVTFPLLHTSKDWATLGDAVPRIIASRYIAPLLVIHSLQSIYNLRQTDLKFVGVCLTALREMWNEGINSPDAFILEKFYKVSEKLTPLPAGPDLQPIWNKSLKDVKMEVSNFDSSKIDFKLDEFENWLDLLDVINSNEPRFARKIEFPEKYNTMISRLLPKIKERAGMDFELDAVDECAEEERRLDGLCEILDKISGVFLKIKPEAERARNIARENLFRVEREREYLEDEAAKHEEELDSLRRNMCKKEDSGNKLHKLEAELDIDRLFADL